MKEGKDHILLTFFHPCCFRVWIRVRHVSHVLSVECCVRHGYGGANGVSRYQSPYPQVLPEKVYLGAFSFFIFWFFVLLFHGGGGSDLGALIWLQRGCFPTPLIQTLLAAFTAEKELQNSFVRNYSICIIIQAG